MSEQEWLDRDFYADLGVSSQASADEIKRAYRRLARENHPDVKPNDSEAEETFKRVSEAYSVLSDPDKRQQYDHTRQLAGSGAGARPGAGGFGSRAAGGTATGGVDLGDLFGFRSGGMGMGDAESLFESLFGGAGTRQRRSAPARGADTEAELRLDFRTAARGGTLPLQLASDTGSTRSLQVRIPPGIDEGQQIRLAGQGRAGSAGAPAGDLYIQPRITADAVFGRAGSNLTVTLPVTVPEAALGATVSAPTLDGSVALKIPAGSPSGRNLRVRGRGLPTRNGHGDLIVTLTITVPEHLSETARQALESYAEATAEHDPRGALHQRNHTTGAATAAG